MGSSMVLRPGPALWGTARPGIWGCQQEGLLGHGGWVPGEGSLEKVPRGQAFLEFQVEATSLDYDLASKVTQRHFCGILFVKSKSEFPSWLGG